MITDKAVRQAIYLKLNVAGITARLGSGSASIVYGVAPAEANAAYPLVVFHKLAGTPVPVMGGQAFKSHVWLVKAVSRDTSPSTAEDIDKAINDLLDFGTLTISGGRLMHMARESDVSYTEDVGDILYRHHGAQYRVIVE